MMGQQGPWMQQSQTTVASASEAGTTKAESEARAARRAVRKEMEE